MKKKIVICVLLCLIVCVSCFAFVGCGKEEVHAKLDYMLTDQFHAGYTIPLGSTVLKPEDPTYENYTFNPGRGGLSMKNGGGYQHKTGWIMENPRMANGYKANKNYVFIGWYKEAECIRPWNFAEDRIHKDTTLYAKWIEKTW